MPTRSHIQWTDATWNPTTGCTRVSAGCDNCYAFALHDKRFAANLSAARAASTERRVDPVRQIAEAREAGVKLPWLKQYDLPFSRIQLLPERLDWPLRQKKPMRIFVDSMADLFHEDVPFEFIDQVWLTMVFACRHIFQVLTKRPERMRVYCERDLPVTNEYIDRVVPFLDAEERVTLGNWARKFGSNGWTPPPNIWLGTSVEDQQSADERIPHLLATPAAVRFLSCEPLLGPVDLRRSLGWRGARGVLADDYDGGTANLRDSGLHWVIIGGESGPRARPMDLAWARSIVEQCRAAGIAVFVKQLGATAFERLPLHSYDGSPAGFREDELYMRDQKGGDPDEWPEDLRVREWPDSDSSTSSEGPKEEPVRG